MLPFLAGCRVYVPLQTAPQPGTRLALDLSDEGRVGMGSAIGSGVARVEGRLAHNSDTTYVVQVSDVVALGGKRARWNGETLSVRRQYVSRVAERRLSRPRTILTILGTTAGVVAFIASRGLLGFGGGSDSGPGDGPVEQ